MFEETLKYRDLVLEFKASLVRVMIDIHSYKMYICINIYYHHRYHRYCDNQRNYDAILSTCLESTGVKNFGTKRIFFRIRRKWRKKKRNNLLRDGCSVIVFSLPKVQISNHGNDDIGPVDSKFDLGMVGLS